MITTAQIQSPPHLIRPFPVASSYVLGMTPPLAAQISSSGEQIAAARGIKGFFSRSKFISPNPAEPVSTRSRLRSFIGEATKVGTSSKAPHIHGRGRAEIAPSKSSKEGTSRQSHRTLSEEATAGRQGLQKKVESAIKPQPVTPTERTQRRLRLDPTALPAIQRGDDGKWQPPSLSRGSMSTSALAPLAQDDDHGKARTSALQQGDNSVPDQRQQPLFVLFPSSHMLGLSHRSSPSSSKKQLSTERWKRRNDTEVPKEGGANKSQTILPSRINAPCNYSSPTQSSSTKAANESPECTAIGQSHRRMLGQADPASVPPVSISARSPSSRPSRPFPSDRSRTMTISPSPTKRLSSGSITMLPPPVPVHARHNSAPSAMLSRDHYLLRLSASFLVKSLTPVFRSSAFSQNAKNAEIKRLVDERLIALGRMEKAWGADWVRVAGALSSGEKSVAVSEDPTIGSLEAKVRLTYVGERAKERERSAWVDALKDGILLCFLLNHLFPAQPSHIPRVNVTEDGLLRAINVTRFIAACQTVGLPEKDVFSIENLQVVSETSLGKVANTIVSLAKLAGPANCSIGQIRSPELLIPNCRPLSRTAAGPSRSPSQLTKIGSALTSPQGSQSKPYTKNEFTSQPPSPTRAVVNRQRSHESANDLLVKLEVATNNTLAVDLDDPAAWRTPTTSTFALPAITPDHPGMKRQPLTRSSIGARISPSLRPKSPDASPSSRSSTPIARVPNLQARPALRPRNATGSNTSVSFVEEVSKSPHSTGTDRASMTSLIPRTVHSLERTPSLISSDSRVTSSVYSRSSAALSVATITGDEHETVVDVMEREKMDETSVMKIRERCMSEKTLQNARQKIFGTLLSSEDLLRDLSVAIQQQSGDAAASDDQERNTAISRSLAALEGIRTSPRPDHISTSPRARPIARRGQSLEAGRQDVSRVLKEDEQSEGASSVLTNGSSRPSVMRKLSSNGKFYIPKRSLSPASGMSSPTGISFPMSSSLPCASGMARGSSFGVSTSTTEHLGRPTDRAERRQSDGFPRDRQQRQDGTIPSIDSARPMQMRISSMVNLPTSSSGPPSMFRVSSASSVVKTGQAPQLLELQEAGGPAIKYQLGNCIGRGQFGSVYRALNLSTGQMVAVKRIRLHGMREDEVCDVMREVELLKQLSHPSIVKYEGMSRDEDYLNIVLEFVENGSLGQTLKAFGHLNEKLVLSYVAKILEGLDYLHSQGVVHCDVKAANILSTKNGNVKLSDFGVSLNMKAVENIKQDAATPDKGGIAKKRVSEVAGTPNWMAPEVISLAGASFASDIWSLGCTIIELLTGRPPYSDITNSMTVLFRIVEDEMPPLPTDISADLKDFLQLCFIKDPSVRPKAAILFEHPWLKALTPELALRPQDSVPFLRRVSMEIRRVDSQKIFAHGESTRCADVGNGVRSNRHSVSSSHCREGSEETGFKRHSIIKTSFGTSVTCRVCLIGVKKAGILCQGCGLIAHMGCASKASPRCDIQEQLALYARQQELLQAGPILRRPPPMPSFERDREIANSPLTALPGKLLNGFKRSKSGLIPSTTSQSDLRSPHATPSNRPPDRPSLRADPDSRLESSLVQNRTSMYSQISDETEDQGRSAIRFAITDVAPLEGPSEDKEKVRIGVLPSDIVAGMKSTHQRGKESKSDCCIQ